MSKDEIARIVDEVLKLDEVGRKKVLKALKKSMREQPGSADTPAA